MEKPQEVIRKTNDGTLDSNSLLEEMDWVDYQYYQAGFKDRAKLEFHRFAAIKMRPLEIFIMYCGVGMYCELKKAIINFENGSRSFSSADSDAQVVSNKWLEKQETKDVKLLFCSNVRVQIMETKIDTSADLLSSLTFLLKKGQSAAVSAASTDRNHRRVQNDQFLN